MVGIPLLIYYGVLDPVDGRMVSLTSGVDIVQIMLASDFWRSLIQG